jgi:hypothetical protein
MPYRDEVAALALRHEVVARHVAVSTAERERIRARLREIRPITIRVPWSALAIGLGAGALVAIGVMRHAATGDPAPQHERPIIAVPAGNAFTALPAPPVFPAPAAPDLTLPLDLPAACREELELFSRAAACLPGPHMSEIDARAATISTWNSLRTDPAQAQRMAEACHLGALKIKVALSAARC